jgi:hypothetical protein
LKELRVGNAPRSRPNLPTNEGDVYTVSPEKLPDELSNPGAQEVLQLIDLAIEAFPGLQEIVPPLPHPRPTAINISLNRRFASRVEAVGVPSHARRKGSA